MPGPSSLLSRSLVASSLLQAMGLSGEVGVLRPGAGADIVLIGLESSTYARLVCLSGHLVYGEDGRSIRMVMVDGEMSCGTAGSSPWTREPS